MANVAVIIPYFQREPGILRRALNSILAQEIPRNIHVDVIVVDDGSPAPVQDEIGGLIFLSPFELTVISQTNCGVAAARNAGLKKADNATEYIAFLDSDDIWLPGHLAHAIIALAYGNDLYFTDNKRVGHHESYFAKCCPKILQFVNTQSLERGFVPIQSSDLVGLVLEHFATQASSVVYRRSAFPDHFFPQSQKFSGEDLIFFTRLVSNAKKICFSPEVRVECGNGINMYFSNIGWDSPKLLSIIGDQIRAFLYMRRTVSLGAQEDKLGVLLSFYRQNFVFHSVRNFVKSRGKIPPEIMQLAKDDKELVWWFGRYFVVVLVGKALGTYKPT